MSVSGVFPFMHALVSIHLQPSEDDLVTVFSFKTEVGRSLKQRLFDESVPVTNKLAIISAYCDPRHKHLSVLCDADKLTVKEHVFVLMSASVAEDENVNVSPHEGESVSGVSEDAVADEHMHSKKPLSLT